MVSQASCRGVPIVRSYLPKSKMVSASSLVSHASCRDVPIVRSYLLKSKMVSASSLVSLMPSVGVFL